MKKPDWKCVFTYVQSFYRRFRNGRDGQSPTKILQQLKRQEEEQQQQQQTVRRGPKHQYILRSEHVVEPFENYKNYSIKPLPKTTFSGAADNGPRNIAPNTSFNRTNSTPVASSPNSNYNKHYKFPFSRINSVPECRSSNIVSVTVPPVKRNDVFNNTNIATPPNTPTTPTSVVLLSSLNKRHNLTSPPPVAVQITPLCATPNYIQREKRECHTNPGPISLERPKRPSTPSPQALNERHNKRQQSLPPIPRTRPPPPPPITF